MPNNKTASSDSWKKPFNVKGDVHRLFHSNCLIFYPFMVSVNVFLIAG